MCACVSVDICVTSFLGMCVRVSAFTRVLFVCIRRVVCFVGNCVGMNVTLFGCECVRMCL